MKEARSKRRRGVWFHLHKVQEQGKLTYGVRGQDNGWPWGDSGRKEAHRDFRVWCRSASLTAGHTDVFMLRYFTDLCPYHLCTLMYVGYTSMNFSIENTHVNVKMLNRNAKLLHCDLGCRVIGDLGPRQQVRRGSRMWVVQAAQGAGMSGSGQEMCAHWLPTGCVPKWPHHRWPSSEGVSKPCPAGTQGYRVTEEPEEMGPLLISPEAHQNKSVYNLYILGLFKVSQGELRGGQIIPLWNHLLDGGGRKCF